MTTYCHSVILNQEKCDGCSKCLHKCPTNAIRIVGGKARIIKSQCIDCGQCLVVCPSFAKGAEVETLSQIKKYKYKVVLPSIPFYGQFPIEFDTNVVYNALIDLGFDDVYDVAHVAELVSEYEKILIEASTESGPLISTYCPVIIRMIQIKFPALIDNIMPLESPMEIAARHVRKELVGKGMNNEDIGIFYITPCPAQVTSIKKPIGLEKSYVNGAIATQEIYLKVMKNINDVKSEKTLQKSTGKGIGWGRVGGQSYAMDIEDYIAVDGLEEVVKVLESMELGKLDSIKFFEGYACVNGCVGGPLNVENTFIAKNRIRKLSKKYGMENEIAHDLKLDHSMMQLDQPIDANNILKLDGDFSKAIYKMDKIDKLTETLPGINCGVCGAPTCRVFAEDLVKGRSNIENCVILQYKKQNMK